MVVTNHHRQYNNKPHSKSNKHDRLTAYGMLLVNEQSRNNKPWPSKGQNYHNPDLVKTTLTIPSVYNVQVSTSIA